MATDPTVMLIVTNIIPSPETRNHVLIGHDFRTDQDTPVPDLEGGIHVVTSTESAFVPRPELHRMHVWNKGWCWTILDPKTFPSPPFLLTTESRFRRIYEGEVELRMHGLIEEDVEDELSRNLSLDLPVIGEQFVGLLRVASVSSHRANLIAYSAEASRLLGTLENVVLGNEARTSFGTLSLDFTDSGRTE